MRIVSLLPAATEMVCQLGLANRLAGISHECDYPPEVTGLPRVTRSRVPDNVPSREIDEQVSQKSKEGQPLFELDCDLLEELEPELIVTQGLCDVCAVSTTQVASVAASLPGKPRVAHLQPARLGEMLDSLQSLGEAAGVPGRAREIVQQLRERIEKVRFSTGAPARRPRVVLLEWVDPLFSSGHWTPEIVRIAGGQEMLGKDGELSRRLDWDEVRRADPEFLVLALCGFKVDRGLADWPILQDKPGFRELACARDGKVFIVDGNAYFNRPGPRLVDSLEILAHTLHPDLFTLPEGLPKATRVV